jgi:hypothetical protein
MTIVPYRLSSPGRLHEVPPAAELSRRLAAAGLGVQAARRGDTCELTILGATTGKSLLVLATSGLARWYFEPAAGPGTSPAALTTIIGHLLGIPRPAASSVAYRALPLKGQVGRTLQDQGLTVTLRVCEDLESFEATTDIDITNPTRPWLGTVTVSDDAALDWHLNWRAAFHDNACAFIDLITPILRDRGQAISPHACIFPVTGQHPAVLRFPTPAPARSPARHHHR